MYWTDGKDIVTRYEPNLYFSEIEAARLLEPLEVVRDRYALDGLDGFYSSFMVDSRLELSTAVAILCEESAFGRLALFAP